MKEWRLSRRRPVSQGRLGKRIGKSQSHVSRYESGTVPNWKTAARIEEVTRGAVPIASWFEIEIIAEAA
jgi:transcriptional regulator with XRE-family HTH domain